MDLLEWARNEIEISCKRYAESDNNEEYDMSDYYRSCCESAYKAFKSLVDDDHSRASIIYTRNILMDLINEILLTPIEDNDEWILSPSYNELDYEYTCYTSKRLRGFYKYVYKDGVIKYVDLHRTQCIDINSPNVPFTNNHLSSIVNEMFPITLPYNRPRNKYVVTVNELLLDKNSKQDYDTIHVIKVTTPNREEIMIDRYFIDDENNNRKEISKEEFNDSIKKFELTDNSITIKLDV